jgi:23S rRNA (uracil1939-C5)-methyltransferase
MAASGRAGVPPRCPVQAACGGCPLLGQSEEGRAQWQLARFERLAREAGLELPPLRWHAAPAPFGYRNRLRLRVDERAQPAFFNREKASDCAVVAPGVLAALAELRAAAQADPALLAGFSHLELRDRDALGRFGLRCALRPEAAGRELARPVRAPFLGAHWLSAVTPCSPSALPCQRWQVAEGLCIEVPLDAFVQINGPVNQLLVAHVAEGLAQRGARDFADLFMGAGNFALPLLAAGLTGSGVERHAGAVMAARRVALERGFGAEGFVCDDARVAATRWALAGVRVDAVVCDPPRAGLGASSEGMARLAKRWLVLCSCRPETLCADLRRLVGEGFAIEAVSLFDMFPQTRHVEAVAWLERRRAAPAATRR